MFKTFLSDSIQIIQTLLNHTSYQQKNRSVCKYHLFTTIFLRSLTKAELLTRPLTQCAQHCKAPKCCWLLDADAAVTVSASTFTHMLPLICWIPTTAKHTRKLTRAWQTFEHTPHMTFQFPDPLDHQLDAHFQVSATPSQLQMQAWAIESLD